MSEENKNHNEELNNLPIIEIGQCYEVNPHNVAKDALDFVDRFDATQKCVTRDSLAALHFYIHSIFEDERVFIVPRSYFLDSEIFNQKGTPIAKIATTSTMMMTVMNELIEVVLMTREQFMKLVGFEIKFIVDKKMAKLIQ